MFSRQKKNFLFIFMLNKFVCVISYRPYQSTNSQEHITFVKYVHDKLAAICSESGLQGICYRGGPLCPHCKDFKQVLHLVRYEEGQKFYHNLEETIRCSRCFKDSNIYQRLTTGIKCHPGL